MNIPIRQMDAYDVIVVGGGIAGISASVSAARLGKSALLIEKSINLGGLATAGLINWYEPLCDGTGSQRLGGMAEELLRLAVKFGFDNLPKKWHGQSNNQPRNDRFSTYYSPTFFSLALDEFVEESGAHILYDTLATYPVMDKKLCLGIITENIDGRCFYPAKVIIDTTGDASIFVRAGAKTQEFNNFLTYIVHETDYENTKNYIESHDLCKLRRWKNCGSDYLGNGHPKGMKLWHGTTCNELNEFIKQGKKRMLKTYDGTDKNSRDILSLPTIPQLRVIRRIIGEYTFDGLDNTLIFPDTIGNASDFRKRGVYYSIPYRCLYSSAFPNLIAAGRIVSAVGDGMEILRVIPCCALTGQAAGVAATIAIEDNLSIKNISYSKLRNKLENSNVIF